MVAIYLGQRAGDSRVILNGLDISSSVVAVEVYADCSHEGQRDPTRVVLTLLGPVEIHGDPEVVIVHPPTGKT